MQAYKEILATIHVAHHFGSAFTPDEVYRLLRIEMSKKAFDEALNELIITKKITARYGALFATNLEQQFLQKKHWSRRLFNQYKKNIRRVTKLPWVKSVILTGANTFESCAQNDDIDLFVIAEADRLWICYLLLVLYSKIFRKRDILCINFLVDENNLEIPQHDYFTAVQIVQMIPLLNEKMAEDVIKMNPWLFEFLPNANTLPLNKPFYKIGAETKKTPHRNKPFKFLKKVNQFIFRQYEKRLASKYPREFGKCIVLSEGRAKLNRVNHQQIYVDIFPEIYRKIEAAELV